MSKDQLNLFGEDPDAPAKTAVETTSAPSPIAPPADTPAVKPKRASKKASAKKSDGLQDLYSKKDWSPLTSAPAPTPAVSPSSSSSQASAASAEETRVESKTVKIPVVKASELAYEKPTDEKEKVLSVSELNKFIREILEGRFPTLWLKAEISNFKAHTSGHFYFSLKDSKAQINAVMFRGYNGSLRFRPEDGMEVLVRGKITVYEPRGNYQIFCEMMEPVGAGALQKAFEQLKSKLQKEGLFSQDRKRALPAHPKHIAIVTSPTGAAIRDMLNVLGRRHKGVHITVIPCKVQGDAAPGEIVAAMQLAQKLNDIDVMIVGRGGGSIEDLWAFNDERVARAIAASRVPVISAVGHEVDFTIADFVADLRAPTPSAAAELVVANSADLVRRVATLTRSLTLALAGRLETAREQLKFYTRRLIDPQRLLLEAAQRNDELVQRLEMSILRQLSQREASVELLRTRLGTPLPRLMRARDQRRSLDQRLRSRVQSLLIEKKQSLAKQMAVLDSLSPLKVLDRGYSMVTVGDSIITHAKDLKAGDQVHIRMCEGSIEAEVKKVNTER